MITYHTDFENISYSIFLGMKKLGSDFSALLAIHFATMLFGLAGLFAKWISEPAIVIVFGRVFFASMVLLPLIKSLHLRCKPFSKSDGLYLFLLGGLLAFHWLTFFHSIKVSTVAIGLLAYSTFPVFTSVLEPILLKENFYLLNLMAACFCLLGIFYLVPSFDFQQPIFQGVLWGVIAGFTFSFLSIANRRLTRRYQSLVIAFYQDSGASILLLPLIILRNSIPEPIDLARMAFLGIFCTAAAHSLFIQGMKKISAATASIISSLEPVYGIILASLFLKEIPAFRTLIGGTIILLSAILVSFRPRPSQ